MSASESSSNSDASVDDRLDEAAESLRRIDLDDAGAGDGGEEGAGDGPANGLAKLVLSLVQLLHDLLEKQAIRRMESGNLSEEEVERVGLTLKRQAETIEELCDAFGIDASDLDLPLGNVRYVEDEA